MTATSSADGDKDENEGSASSPSSSSPLVWQPVGADRRRGVAVANFKPQAPETSDEVQSLPEIMQLPLLVGDLVLLAEECDEGWYLGSALSNPSLMGIFPKVFVRPAVVPGGIASQAVVAEIGEALKEWHSIIKAMFVKQHQSNNEKEIRMIQGIMREVMSMRELLVADKMTLAEAKETRLKVTTKLDFLNHLLNLDLVARDSEGNIIDQARHSVVSMYRHHVKSAEKVKTMMTDRPKDDIKTSNSFRISLRVKNFVSTKIVEDVDLIFSIYEVADGKVPKALCENYVVKSWSRNPRDLDEVERRKNLRVVFGDINKNDIQGKRLFLICQIVCEGNFCSKATDNTNEKKLSKSQSKGHIKEISFRKPVGVSAAEITHLFTFRQGKTIAGGSDVQKNEFSCPLMLGGEAESLETTFKKLIFEKKGSAEQKSLWVEIGIIFGVESARQSMIISRQSSNYNSVVGGGGGYGSVCCQRQNPHHLMRLQHHFQQHKADKGGQQVPMAKKIGLPDIILPNDVRNDLYVNVFSGEFSRGEKRQDRNIEITVEVCDVSGKVLPNALSHGVGSFLSGDTGLTNDDGGIGCNEVLCSSYRSVVYYHDGKPKWNELVKVVVRADQFAGTHLRFTVRHRSRHDTKDKTVAPYAVAFLKLVKEEDGTAVKDGVHELIVYRLDKKAAEAIEASTSSTNGCGGAAGGTSGMPSYLDLPYLKSGIAAVKTSKHGGSSLQPLNRDALLVQTTLASTKLTQNEGLLSLLKWKSEPNKLSLNLQMFDQKVNGDELVKFIPDVLDALFSILMENPDSEQFDDKVFRCLIKCISLITDDGVHHHFIPVLELYINENFYAALAYGKLMVALRECADNATLKPKELVQAMKCLKYIFKFVVRSRTLYAGLNALEDQEAFEDMLKDVLHSLVKVMFGKSDDLHQAQAFCLRHIVQSVPDLVTVFSGEQLSEILVQMIKSLPDGQLNEEKVDTIRDLVHSQLFRDPQCRMILLPQMAVELRDILERGQLMTLQSNNHGSTAVNQSSSRLVRLCTETMGDLLDELHDAHNRLGTRPEDVSEVMLTCLRTVIQSVANRQRGDRNIRSVVANLIEMLGSMTPFHYNQYVLHFDPDDPGGRENLVDFLMEALGMFQDLIKNNVFEKDWNSMKMAQNGVILKALRQFSITLQDYLRKPFDQQSWTQFFQCAIAFITQPALQVERLSQNRRQQVTRAHGDMRKEMGLEVKKLWFTLCQHKIAFIPEMVGDFLEMTLIPETELRRATIPIFFDMMQCEYYSLSLSNGIADNQGYNASDGNNGGNKRDSNIGKQSFAEFETELVTKLDDLVGDVGLGDQHYLHLFSTIMNSLCEDHLSMRIIGKNFISLASRLMELLLEYHRMINLESDSSTTAGSAGAAAETAGRDNRMSCIVNLLDFYQAIGREELYIKYLKKLALLHEQCNNWAEAGFTLLRYARLLQWSSKPLGHAFWDRYPDCRSQRSLKEQLSREIILKFEKGSLWEAALDICRDLVRQYEEETFEYPKLAETLSLMSSYYNHIMTERRPEPEYFRVAFYGRGFPAFLQNRVFVYRGRGFERMGEFQSRILDQFPNAELMTSLQPPSAAEMERPTQLLQINMVDPVMEAGGGGRFRGKQVHPQILNYYKVNEVSKFMYSRPYFKDKEKNKENEFACLWVQRTVLRTKGAFPGILLWFPIEGEPQVFDLCPLENAIETMRKANEDLRNLILEHQDKDQPLNPLSMKLNGIIDAAVMGGTAMYEKAFFTDKYLKEHPDHDEMIGALQNLIAEQIPLLNVGINLHDEKKTDDLKPFHDRLAAMFSKMKAQVEEKYGKRTCGLSLRRVGGGTGFDFPDQSCQMQDQQCQGPVNSTGKSLTGGSSILNYGSSENVLGSSSSEAMENSNQNAANSSGARTSVNSQASTESSTGSMSAPTSLLLNAMPKSRMLSSVIGITRRKSSAASSGPSQTQQQLLKDDDRGNNSKGSSSLNGGQVSSSNNSFDDGASSSRCTVVINQNHHHHHHHHHHNSTTTVVVTADSSENNHQLQQQQQQQQRSLMMVGSNGGSISRPPSGQFYLAASTSTPNHSRSPSMASNRDSLGGGIGDNMSATASDSWAGGIPPVPPKHLNGSRSSAAVPLEFGENVSLSSFDEGRLQGEAAEGSGSNGAVQDMARSTSNLLAGSDLVGWNNPPLRNPKKKAPPPPPPPPPVPPQPFEDPKTPPTPPKRPPFKPPID